MAETIGSLIDKLSIIRLKIYHMQKQIARQDTSKKHKWACKQKVKIMKIQMADLEKELSELTRAVISGHKKLKVYYQFKMYNDHGYRIKK